MFGYSLAMPLRYQKNTSCVAPAKLNLKISVEPPLGACFVLGAIFLFGGLQAWCAESAAAQVTASSSEAALPDSSPADQAQGDQTPSDHPPADHPPSEHPPSEPAATPMVSEKIPGVALYNMLQKKSIVFPDIATSNRRLSSGQKFQLFVDNSGSVHSISWAVLGAAFGQADNSPTGFEQGWDGYAKRFGASMARSASNEFFGTFVISSALHLDPRFYPEVNPTFGHAMKYSVQRVFVMRNDEGRDVVAWSRLVGPLMAEGLANVYWPERNRTVGDTFFRYGVDLATRAGGNMLREYWPVVFKKMHSTTDVHNDVHK
jgi:hypothetical protein